jgi:excisionase family DNA binding protein
MRQGACSCSRAKWLGVSPVTLYRLMDEGTIPHRGDGRAYRLRQADVDVYVDAHHVELGSLAHLNPPRVERLRLVPEAKSETQ